MIFFLQTSHSHLFLQGDDRLYINQGDSLQKIYHNCKSFPMDSNDNTYKQGNIFSQSYNICTNSYMKGDFMPIDEGRNFGWCFFLLANINNFSFAEHLQSNTEDEYEISNSLQVSSMLSESKHWIVVQLPIAYLSTNWPIRVSI